MAETTIEWTHRRMPDGRVIPGYTFNPWIGCTKVDAGCKHCYAETLMDTRHGRVEWGAAGTRVLTSPGYWDKPKKWNSDAEKDGHKRLVFCASLADVFEDWPGQMRGHDGGKAWQWWDSGEVTFSENRPSPRSSPLRMSGVLDRLLALVDKTPWLIWMLLTKRPENIRGALRERRENIWLGTSISDQESADVRLPLLADVSDLAPVSFVSAEPLLGRVGGVAKYAGQIQMVIVGGESGVNARPMFPGWAREIRDECVGAGMCFFFKQWGAWSPDRTNDKRALFTFAATGIPYDPRQPEQWIGSTTVYRVPVKQQTRLLDGREWHDMPGITP